MTETQFQIAIHLKRRLVLAQSYSSYLIDSKAGSIWWKGLSERKVLISWGLGSGETKEKPEKAIYPLSL